MIISLPACLPDIGQADNSRDIWDYWVQINALACKSKTVNLWIDWSKNRVITTKIYAACFEKCVQMMYRGPHSKMFFWDKCYIDLKSPRANWVGIFGVFNFQTIFDISIQPYLFPLSISQNRQFLVFDSKFFRLNPWSFILGGQSFPVALTVSESDQNVSD